MFAIFVPATGNGFINIDDLSLIVNSPLLNEVELYSLAVVRRPTESRRLQEANLADWEVTEMTQLMLETQITFNKPESLSLLSDSPDYLRVTLDNSSGILVSAETGIPVDSLAMNISMIFLLAPIILTGFAALSVETQKYFFTP